MKTIIIVNGKGGTGKSTITVGLSMGYGEAKKSVYLLDLDPQKTATEWVERTKPVNVRTEPFEADIQLVDTPARSELERHIPSLPQPDLFIIPTTTSPGDQIVAARTFQLIKQYYPNTPAKLLFNMVMASASDSRIIDEFAQAIGAERCKSIIHHRKCYAYAQTQGWEAIQKNKIAFNELINLALELV